MAGQGLGETRAFGDQTVETLRHPAFEGLICRDLTGVFPPAAAFDGGRRAGGDQM